MEDRQNRFQNASMLDGAPPSAAGQHVDDSPLLDEDAEFEDGLRAAEDLEKQSIAVSTKKVYDRAFATFQDWADKRSLEALPATPTAVRAFLASLHKQKRSASRLAVVAAAIGRAHLDLGLDDPTADSKVVHLLQGKRRLDATRQKAKARALMTTAADPEGELQRIIAAIPDDLVGLRDKALLLLGWGGAFRRSEHSQLLLSNLEWRPTGLKVHLPKSKGDQLGQGTYKVILAGGDLCPVRALQRWLDALEVATNRMARCRSTAERGALPLFVRFGRAKTLPDGSLQQQPRATMITPQVVNLRLKLWAEQAGVDPEALSGHSLRRGFIKSAARLQRPLEEIQGMSLHKTLGILMNEYIEPEASFERNAGRGLL